MKRATMILAALLATGAAGVVMTGPAAEAKHSSQDDSSSLIKKGMTLEEAEQATNGSATKVGAPRNGVQTYRISFRQFNGDGGVNDHPTTIVYTFGIKDGKITWVHKQA